MRHDSSSGCGPERRAAEWPRTNVCGSLSMSPVGTFETCRLHRAMSEFEVPAALGRLAIAPIEPGDTGDERARGEQRLRRGALRQRLAERARKAEQQTDRRGEVAHEAGAENAARMQ